MHEPFLPGAADRLSPNDPSGLRRRLTAILQSSPAPTLCVAGTRDEGGDVMVAGAALLDLARHRILALQKAGMRPGDLLASDAVGIARVVDALASVLGGFVYWPFSDHRRIADGALVMDSGAPLVWRPNPLVGMGFPAGIPNEPPAALPMRLSVRLSDLMLPAGPQIRLLANTASEESQFAINAQTVARLGATVRRKLAIRRQSVRYCAAPAESAAGMLLDLLPGIAARQVMVVPCEPSPSSLTVIRAIARYRPDSLTLTLPQATAIIDTPIDDETRHVLKQCSVLIADTHPVPHLLRDRFRTSVAQLDVAYILPEAGDAVLL